MRHEPVALLPSLPEINGQVLRPVRDPVAACRRRTSAEGHSTPPQGDRDPHRLLGRQSPSPPLHCALWDEATRLPDTDGKLVALEDFTGRPALLVMFVCNHCPYVKHVADELAKLTSEYMEKGVGVVAINSNDVVNYPEDSPEKMAAEKRARGYRFPYLFDESQEVAKAYDAACTPDFYVFDKNLKLAYRGQMDASRPSSAVPVTGVDLRAALDALLNEVAPKKKTRKPRLTKTPAPVQPAAEAEPQIKPQKAPAPKLVPEQNPTIQ